jgi:hypothetical protein
MVGSGDICIHEENVFALQEVTVNRGGVRRR